MTACLANVSSLLYHALQGQQGVESVNWCGFYLQRPIEFTEEETGEKAEDSQSTLVLGPFHGQPAVTVIAPGHGVCGTCVVERRTQLVEDVHLHPNHIACDERSQSEVVVPVFDGTGDRRLMAVLDVDCPRVRGFGEEDVVGLEAIAALVSEAVDWSQGLHPLKMKRRSRPLTARHSHHHPALCSAADLGSALVLRCVQAT
jgi:L-methionine (R)-S-oxide reductase